MLPHLLDRELRGPSPGLVGIATVAEEANATGLVAVQIQHRDLHPADQRALLPHFADQKISRAGSQRMACDGLEAGSGSRAPHGSVGQRSEPDRATFTEECAKRVHEPQPSFDTLRPTN